MNNNEDNNSPVINKFTIIFNFVDTPRNFIIAIIVILLLR